MVASDQLAELNEKLAVQKVAVTEKSEACEKLLAVISENTEKAIEKKQMAEAKKEEIAEQNKLIVVEKVRVIYYLFYFISLLPQGQGHHNSVSQLLWARITYPTLSTFPVGGNRSTQRKPTTFGRALTILFSPEDWVRVYLTGDRTRNFRGERRVV